MKITKKLLSVLLAFTLVIGLFLAPAEVVNAKISYGAVPAKVRINTNSTSQTFSFDLPGYGYTIKNVKSSSSKLKVKQTYHYATQSSGIADMTNYAKMTLYTQKEGTYKVTFDIVDANGVTASSNTVKVYAYNESPLKSLKIGKNSITLNTTNNTSTSSTDKYLLKGKSGKVKVSMAKGYKITKIEYGVYDAEGSTIVYTTIKNNAKITYGTNIYQRSYKYEDIDEDYFYRNMYWSKAAMADTNIRVTYIDKYTKAEDTETYFFYQWVD